ncbi:helix-turn-helix domain-containing protein [Bacillus cereus group sp. BfR-BA-01331]|uniref:helix-turn-helix domain-containing protein n=1 Tax=Bacillus cereus group sp. BfR-BA-01331 TaxID=2920307 RepID=UPI001F57B288|nr:helix-turn-helix domain-containing protein [Bacillus cereus group sp. BfR-BA-01331]
MNYISFEELCTTAKLSKGQLSYLIKHKQIEPANLKSWKADGGYRFHEEDARRILEIYKDLYTLKEAATYLQKSKTYVSNMAKEGALPFKEVSKGKRREKLYHIEDLKEFKRSMDNVNKESQRMYDHIPLHTKNLLLFDSVTLDGQPVRVIDVTKRSGINLQNEYMTIPEDVSSNHFSQKCIQATRITKPGDVTFLFPLYTAYDVMLYIISHLGASNVLVSKKNEGYLMKCKLGNIPYDAHIFRVLNTCLISGYLQQEKDRIYFTNNKEHVSLYLDRSIIENAKQKAAEKGYKGYKKVLEEILADELSN